jgi:hypothetical protein
MRVYAVHPLRVPCFCPKGSEKETAELEVAHLSRRKEHWAIVDFGWQRTAHAVLIRGLPQLA